MYYSQLGAIVMYVVISTNVATTRICSFVEETKIERILAKDLANAYHWCRPTPPDKDEVRQFKVEFVSFLFPNFSQQPCRPDSHPTNMLRKWLQKHLSPDYASQTIRDQFCHVPDKDFLFVSNISTRYLEQFWVPIYLQMDGTIIIRRPEKPVALRDLEDVQLPICDDLSEMKMHQTLMHHWFKRQWHEQRYFFRSNSVYRNLSDYKRMVCPLQQFYNGEYEDWFGNMKIRHLNLALPDGQLDYVIPSFLVCKCPLWTRIKFIAWRHASTISHSSQMDLDVLKTLTHTNRTKVCFHATTKDIYLQNFKSKELEGHWFAAYEQFTREASFCEYATMVNLRKNHPMKKNLLKNLDQLFQDREPEQDPLLDSHEKVLDCFHDFQNLLKKPHRFSFVSLDDMEKDQASVYFSIPVCISKLEGWSWEFLPREDTIEDPFHYDMVDNSWILTDTAEALKKPLPAGLKSDFISSNLSSALFSAEHAPLPVSSILGTYIFYAISGARRILYPIYFHIDILEYPKNDARFWSVERTQSDNHSVIETFALASFFLRSKMQELAKEEGRQPFTTSLAVKDHDVCGALTYSIGSICTVKHSLNSAYPNMRTQADRLTELLLHLNSTKAFQSSMAKMFGSRFKLLDTSDNSINVPCHFTFFKYFKSLLVPRRKERPNRIEYSLVHVLCAMKDNMDEMHTARDLQADRTTQNVRIGHIPIPKMTVQVVDRVKEEYSLKCPIKQVKHLMGNETQQSECKNIHWKEQTEKGYFRPLLENGKVTDKCNLWVKNDKRERTFACFLHSPHCYPNMFMLGLFSNQVEEMTKENKTRLGLLVILLFFLVLCFFCLGFAFLYDRYLTQLENLLDNS